jgi:hypothetical protein
LVAPGAGLKPALCNESPPARIPPFKIQYLYVLPSLFLTIASRFCVFYQRIGLRIISSMFWLTSCYQASNGILLFMDAAHFSWIMMDDTNTTLTGSDKCQRTVRISIQQRTSSQSWNIMFVPSVLQPKRVFVNYSCSMDPYRLSNSSKPVQLNAWTNAASYWTRRWSHSILDLI